MFNCTCCSFLGLKKYSGLYFLHGYNTNPFNWNSINIADTDSGKIKQNNNFKLWLTYVPLSPIVLAALNLIQRGVREVEFLCAVVDGETVRGSDVAPNDDENVGACQCGAHDARRLLVPIGPEHKAAEENPFENSIV